jgi:hypothetical protein
MDEAQIREIAERACREENLNWSVFAINPNTENPKQWEIYYDAWNKKYHRILFRSTPQADSTGDTLKAELRDFLRQLKQSGRL